MPQKKTDKHNDSRKNGSTHELHLQNFVQDLKIPLPLVQVIERILCIPDLNEGLSAVQKNSAAAYSPSVFIAESLKYLGVSVQVNGEENLNGLIRPILVSNHPLGCLDGLALLHTLFQHFDTVKLMANDLLSNFVQLSPILIPVHELRQTRRKIEIYEALFHSNAAILHFPAGICSRKQKGTIQDTEWQSTYIKLSQKFNRPIVPCFFEGRNSNIFYVIAKLRSILGIQVNIEMYLLIAEMFKKVGVQLECRLAQAIHPEELRGIRPSEANTHIRSSIYELGSIG